MNRETQKTCPQCGKPASGNTTLFSVDRHCLACNLWWHNCDGGLKLGMSTACRLCNDDLAPFRDVRPVRPSFTPSFVPRPTPPSFFSPAPPLSRAYTHVQICRNCGSSTCPAATCDDNELCTSVSRGKKNYVVVCDNCGYSTCRCANDDDA